MTRPDATLSRRRVRQAGTVSVLLRGGWPDNYLLSRMKIGPSPSRTLHNPRERNSRHGFTKVLYGARPDWRVDWDVSNARERLPERRRFATAARTRAGPEGSNGNRGPRQHRGRGIPERIDDPPVGGHRGRDAGVHLHGRLEDRPRARAPRIAALLPRRSLRRFGGPRSCVLCHLLAVQGDHPPRTRDVLQWRLLSRLPRSHGVQGFLGCLLPPQRRARLVAV